MRRFTRILQYLTILAVFALAWFIPIEKARPANPGTVPHASVPR
jgi:hypothetical protein